MVNPLAPMRAGSSRRKPCSLDLHSREPRGESPFMSRLIKGLCDFSFIVADLARVRKGAHTDDGRARDPLTRANNHPIRRFNPKFGAGVPRYAPWRISRWLTERELRTWCKRRGLESGASAKPHARANATNHFSTAFWGTSRPNNALGPPIPRMIPRCPSPPSATIKPERTDLPTPLCTDWRSCDAPAGEDLWIKSTESLTTIDCRD